MVTHEYESLLYCHPLSSQPVVYRKECFGADIATQTLGGFFVSEGRRGLLHASGFRVIPTHKDFSFSCPKEASKGGCLPPGRCKIRCLRIHSAQEHRTPTRGSCVSYKTRSPLGPWRIRRKPTHPSAWKGYSQKFAVASDPSGAAAGARQRRGGAH